MRALGSGGTALPGLVVERLQSNAVEQLAHGLAATTLITGTNGKTTTAAMLARILRADGRTVVHNRSGSNLMRGVTAALIEAATPLGLLPFKLQRRPRGRRSGASRHRPGGSSDRRRLHQPDARPA